MSDKPSFDAEYAHKFFSAECFNSAWKIIDKPVRTAEENEQMIRLAQASIWHWTQRADCTDKNLSIGYWQASRIYSLVGEAGNARKYAKLCLANTPTDEPFYLGFACEALARAESLAESSNQSKEYLAQAWHHAEEITNAEEKHMLVDDLKTLE